MGLEQSINHPRYSSNDSETIGAAEMIFIPVATDSPKERECGYTANQNSATAPPETLDTHEFDSKEKR
jgi:hypothetical protein